MKCLDILIVGGARSGKTSLMERFYHENFKEKSFETLGMNVYKKSHVMPSGETIIL
jgi:GTPase SAR1 family protein